MKKRLGVLVMVAGVSAAGATEWFTVVGDPNDPRANTIQIDPIVRKADGPLRSMGLRVSRSMLRTSAGGVTFRSYDATVEFDCDKLTVRFVRSQFYDEPLWNKPGPLRNYPPTDVRPVEFRQIEPNPRDRVIRAACESYRRSATGSTVR